MFKNVMNYLSIPVFLSFKKSFVDMNFCQKVFNINRNNFVIFFRYINIVYFLRVSNIEPALHSWNISFLVMMRAVLFLFVLFWFGFGFLWCWGSNLCLYCWAVSPGQYILLLMWCRNMFANILCRTL